MRPLAIILVAGLLVHCQPIVATPLVSASPQAPAFEQLTGHGVVLALFDLHRDTDQNGTCTSLDPRALIAAHAAMWSHETLVKTSLQPCSGLRIFDVCGSGTIALDTILSELKKTGCNHNITGIITFSSANVYYSIKKLLSRLKIPQTIIWRDTNSLPNSSNPEQHFIRIKSEEKAMSLLELTKSLNWTYVTTKSSDSKDATEEHRSFLDTAAKYGSDLCLSLPGTQKENSDDVSSISSTNAVLYFINGLSAGGQHTPASLTNSTMRVTLFVTDNETDLNQIILNTTTNGLLLKEDVPSIKGVFLGEYLVNKTRLGLNRGSSLSWEWLRNDRFCVQKETGAVNHTECDHSSINRFLSEALNLKASHAAIESVRRVLANQVALFELSDEDLKGFEREKRSQSGDNANVSKDANKFTNATSSDTNGTKTNATNASTGPNGSKVTNVTHQLPKQFLESRFVFKVSNLTRALEPNTTFSLFATVGPVFQKVGQISGSFYPLDKTRWRLISEKLTGSHCPGYCPACNRCTQDTAQIQQLQQQQQQHHQRQESASLIKNYKQGHLYIALVIPLEESASCRLPSKENAKIVEQFLKSVDTLKEEEPTSLLGYTLGGIVIDSCQTDGPPHHRRRLLDENISPFSTCYTLKDVFNISRQVSNKNIVSYIHLPNLNSFSTAKIGEFRTKSTTIPDITISRIGSFLDTIQLIQYVKVILKALASLRWTYLTVVCSENTLMIELQRRLLTEAKKKNICIRDLIKVTELRSAGFLDGRYSVLQDESTAVILLTDAHDTVDFLRSVSKAHNSSNILNFLFFPWNSALHPHLGTNLFQSSILVEINDPVANEIPKNITALSVSELESQLELCLLSPSSSVYCPTGTINRGPTEPVLASYVASFVNAVGRGLAGLHSQLCSDGEEDMCKAYQDWSRVMSLLRQRLRVGPVSLFNNSRKFDSSGTLRVNYAIKNLQRIRGGFQWTQVGEYNTNGSLSLSPKSVQGYNALQDVTTPATQCKRWCPRCYQCDLTLQSGQSRDNDAALYIPGDLLITAVMPVRKRGPSSFECGTINTEDDVDQLVLALLYAVTTAKQRHPDLLDGVNPGLLVLDSCSTKERAMMVAGNFESCSLSIHLQGPNQIRNRRDADGGNSNVRNQAARNIGYYRTWGASPRLSPVYISVGTSDILDAMTSSISDFRKPVLAVDQKGRSRRAERYSDLSDTTLSLSLAARTRMETIVSLLLKYQWTHISVVASESIENRRLIKLFNDLAKEAKVCVNHVLMLEDPELSGGDIFRHSDSDQMRGKSKLKVVSENPSLTISEDVPSSFARALRDLAEGNTTRIAVALVSEGHFMKLNSLVKENGLSIIWIFDQSDSGWEGDLSTSSMPLGSFTIDRQTRVYRGFKEYFNRQSNRRIADDNMNQAMSNWLDQQWDSRFGCDLPGQDSKYGIACPPQDDERHEISPVTTDVIRAADAVMFALQTEYAAKCGSKGGLCAKFARQRQPISLASFQKILVNAENDSFQFSPSREVDTSIAIYNRQAEENGSQLVQVAEWRNRILTPTKGRQIKLYDRSGEELDRNNAGLLMTSPSCMGTRCSCVNIHTEPTPTIKSLNSSTMALTLRREGYSKSTGQFTGTIWATVVMTVAAAGVLTAIGIFFYLLYKYCTGTGGGRRYSLLGMLLLFAIVVQFATILPFVFTANELICEMRYFAPGFGYAFTLGIILVKLMNLYDYRMIGLGGTLSGMNQLLMVLFVGGVQVAVGAQRWLLKGPAFVQVVTYYGVTMYGCAFDKYEFVYYLSYPAFLQIVCLLYSIGMYKEKRNLREAKYVLIACALCIAVWVSWLLVYFLRPDDLRQPAIAVGILVNACLNLAVIFIPKIHMMATLKYDVNKTSQDHYSTKADSDFFFERPFSLPGTLKTSVSDKTYSRSYTAFKNFDHSSGSV